MQCAFRNNALGLKNIEEDYGEYIKVSVEEV